MCVYCHRRRLQRGTFGTDGSAVCFAISARVGLAAFATVFLAVQRHTLDAQVRTMLAEHTHTQAQGRGEKEKRENM